MEGTLEVVSQSVSGAGPAREQPHVVLVPKSTCHGRRPCAPRGAAPFAVTRYRIVKPLVVAAAIVGVALAWAAPAAAQSRNMPSSSSDGRRRWSMALRSGWGSLATM